MYLIGVLFHLYTLESLQGNFNQSSSYTATFGGALFSGAHHDSVSYMHAHTYNFTPVWSITELLRKTFIYCKQLIPSVTFHKGTITTTQEPRKKFNSLIRANKNKTKQRYTRVTSLCFSFSPFQEQPIT